MADTRLDALTDIGADLADNDEFAVFDASAAGNVGKSDISRIWTYVLSKDGAGSGLDADTVDGIQGAAFLQGTGSTTTDNTVYGVGAGDSVTTGVANTAIGADAGTTIAAGNRNTAVGSGALAAYTSDNNTAIGHLALTAATTGDENVAVGKDSLSALTTGRENTCIGFSAGISVVANGANTFVGHSAGEGMTGANNTGVGRSACGGAAGGSGSNNTALGRQALSRNNTASGNTAVGHGAMQETTNQGNSTAVGSSALLNCNGANNVAVGQGAGYNSNGVFGNAVTSATGVVYLGRQSGSRSAGQFNDSIAIGNNAGVQGTSAIAIGADVTALANGAVAIGVDSSGTAATTSTVDEFVLGTPNHTVVIPGTFVLPSEHGIACSDETTELTSGTAKATFRLPHAMTLTEVRASLTTASTSGAVTVDINENGASLLSTKLTIDQDEKTSTTAATAAVISDSALADDAEITVDIDGAGTGAAGLKVWLIGTRNL